MDEGSARRGRGLIGIGGAVFAGAALVAAAVTPVADHLADRLRGTTDIAAQSLTGPHGRGAEVRILRSAVQPQPVAPAPTATVALGWPEALGRPRPGGGGQAVLGLILVRSRAEELGGPTPATVGMAELAAAQAGDAGVDGLGPVGATGPAGHAGAKAPKASKDEGSKDNAPKASKDTDTASKAKSSSKAKGSSKAKRSKAGVRDGSIGGEAGPAGSSGDTGRGHDAGKDKAGKDKTASHKHGEDKPAKG